MNRTLFLIFACTLLLPSVRDAVLAAPAEESVPFVGCESDGQVGPQAAPNGKSPAVRVATDQARKIAYYTAGGFGGFGVLAPRGWYCFGTYGSGGDALYVSPEPIDSATIFSRDWKGFTGPAVAMIHRLGDTSGRSGVAEIIARVFPAHKGFVDGVRKMDLGGPFPSGPYPTDRLTYKSKEIVEYVTPGQTEGLGTNSRLNRNADAIGGVAILIGPTTALLLLSVRLPPDLTDLTTTIVHQFERAAIAQSH